MACCSSKQVGEIKIYCPLMLLPEIRSQIHSDGEVVATSIEIRFWNQRFQGLEDRILRATDLNKSEGRNLALLPSDILFHVRSMTPGCRTKSYTQNFKRWEQPRTLGLGYTTLSPVSAVVNLNCSMEIWRWGFD
jgi:hypothetical protein